MEFKILHVQQHCSDFGTRFLNSVFVVTFHLSSMANKRKRSRIVLSTDTESAHIASASYLADTPATTRTTDDNSRSSAAHTVTLRTNNQYDTRRQRRNQLSAHTEVHRQETPLDEECIVDDTGEECIDTVAGDGDEDKAAESPKRPPVRVMFKLTMQKSELENPQPRPCQEWLPYRQEYLDELHRHDAGGDQDQPSVCSNCNVRDGIIKCVDCDAGTLQCTECTVKCHGHLALHRIQVRALTIRHYKGYKLI